MIFTERWSRLSNTTLFSFLSYTVVVNYRKVKNKKEIKKGGLYGTVESKKIFIFHISVRLERS